MENGFFAILRHWLRRCVKNANGVQNTFGGFRSVLEHLMTLPDTAHVTPWWLEKTFFASTKWHFPAFFHFYTFLSKNRKKCNIVDAKKVFCNHHGVTYAVSGSVLRCSRTLLNPPKMFWTPFAFFTHLLSQCLKIAKNPFFIEKNWFFQSQSYAIWWS